MFIPMNPNVVLIFIISDVDKFHLKKVYFMYYIFFDLGMAVLFFIVGIYFYKSYGIYTEIKEKK